ncbi:kinase-associated lipoprotein B [Cohnella lubricantis]|uniref:kinase-associated lipoprotein B n=1 Tax=Cohnella lubricantis TaxID=2163172 RepID=UPI001FD89C43|nr:kinase-associated lipoprotein B [Cohnella lubricantis]MBP2120606.1 kinase-associated protein B [Cohnella lubricantis]
MENTAEALGRIVKAAHKTGEYIAETMETDGRRTLVQILAVLQHPTQGDLHHPYDPDAPMFHERRASAYREKVWVQTSAIQPYDGAIPPYEESLKLALEAELEKMDRLQRWAQQCLYRLETLRKDYNV